MIKHTLADVVKLMRNPTYAEKIILVQKQKPYLLVGKTNENNVLHKVQHS